MTPFQKNLQKFFIFFFTAASVGIVAIGINRAKNAKGINYTPTPAPGQPTAAQDNTSTGVTTTTTGTAPSVLGTTQATTGAVLAYTGSTYQTPYGNVSAAIKVKDGKVVAVTMPQLPDSPPSLYAQPYLIDQALKAGSANIQGVSGATYTSLAFKASLESAIAAAQKQGQQVTAQAPAGSQSGTSVSGSPSSSFPTPAPSVPRRYTEDD